MLFRSGKYRCTVLIHPDDAAALDVNDRDHVAVTSGESRIVVPVELTPHIKRGVDSMPHGWGHDRPGAQFNVARSNPGVNSNRVNPSEHLDLPSGNAEVNGVPVTLPKVTPSFSSATRNQEQVRHVAQNAASLQDR